MSVEHDPQQTGAPDGGSEGTQGQQGQGVSAETPYSWNQDHANYYAQHFESRLRDPNDPQIKAFITELASTHGLTRKEAAQVVQQAQQTQPGTGSAEMKAMADKIAAFEKRFADQDAIVQRDRNRAALEHRIDETLVSSQFGQHKNPVVTGAMRQILENGLMTGKVRDYSAAGLAKYLDGKMTDLAAAFQSDAKERESAQRKFTALAGGASTGAMGKTKDTLTKEEAAKALAEYGAARYGDNG